MTKVVGVIEVVKKNNAGFWGVKVGDEWYGAGKGAFPFEKGDKITFDVEMNGKYKNINLKSAEKVKDEPKANSAYISNDRRQELIVLQSCQRNAIDLVKNMIEQGVIKLPTKQADKYEVYMNFLQEVHKEVFKQVMFLDVNEVEQEVSQGGFYTDSAENNTDDDEETVGNV